MTAPTTTKKLVFELVDAARLNTYRRAAQREDILFPDSGEYYFVRKNGTIVAITGFIWQRAKVTFKSHYVLPPFRQQGIFREILDWSMRTARSRGYRFAEATCTPSSLPEYRRRGAQVTKQYKRLTKVRLPL